jgi:hypothetical protein
MRGRGAALQGRVAHSPAYPASGTRFREWRRLQNVKCCRGHSVAAASESSRARTMSLQRSWKRDLAGVRIAWAEACSAEFT